ncbi:MAG: hypothetical protein AAF696_01475 [Bacteroidota bacterium]
MKSIKIWLLSLIVLTACTVPGPTDFESTRQPLAQDEFISMWRIPAKGSFKESLNLEKAHLEELERVMQPFFQQLITQIFRDAKEGKLQIHEAEDLIDLDEKVIENLPQKMGQRFGASYQNLGPFMGAIHITQKRKATQKGLPAQELELMIIEQDPEGKAPERLFGAVKIEDLRELDYEFKIDGNTYGLLAFIDNFKDYAYPIFFKSRKLEAGLRSLDQAFKMKDIILEGQWISVNWLGGEPNLTDYKAIELKPQQLEEFAGLYEFKATEGSEEILLEISVEEEHLNVNWESAGPYYGYDIFPSSTRSYFSVYGDQFQFFTAEDGKVGLTKIDADGKETVGYRR